MWLVARTTPFTCTQRHLFKNQIFQNYCFPYTTRVIGHHCYKPVSYRTEHVSFSEFFRFLGVMLQHPKLQSLQNPYDCFFYGSGGELFRFLGVALLRVVTRTAPFRDIRNLVQLSMTLLEKRGFLNSHHYCETCKATSACHCIDLSRFLRCCALGAGHQKIAISRHHDTSQALNDTLHGRRLHRSIYSSPLFGRRRR